MAKEKLEKTVNKIAQEVAKHTEPIDKVLEDVADLKEKSSRIIAGQDKTMVIRTVPRKP